MSDLPEGLFRPEQPGQGAGAPGQQPTQPMPAQQPTMPMPAQPTEPMSVQQPTVPMPAQPAAYPGPQSAASAGYPQSAPSAGYPGLPGSQPSAGYPGQPTPASWGSATPPLYRDAPPAPPPGAPIPQAPPTPTSVPPTDPGLMTRYGASPTTMEPARRSRLPYLIAGILLALALVTGVSVGAIMLLRRPVEIVVVTASPTPRPASATASASSPGPSATTPTPTPTPTPRGNPKPIKPTIQAACTAPDATDEAGKPVSYAATNLTDGNLQTAWRCDGDGNGRELTLTLPANTKVTKLGLINGYTKADPSSGALRYGEYRRLLTVQWVLPGGQVFEQQLNDNVQIMQAFDIPNANPGDKITLKLTRSTPPGKTDPTRDAVLISELQVEGS